MQLVEKFIIIATTPEPTEPRGRALYSQAAPCEPYANPTLPPPAPYMYRSLAEHLPAPAQKRSGGEMKVK